ncbi:MAG: MATE family efflux transporter, partial [Parabacteroides sp.]|nr:MATE family efflux transporter [Parabacteroides sp.]
LVTVTTFFTSTGAKQGDVILAVNTLLMQLFTLFSYFMDGFAYAGEALAGRYVGASNKNSLNRMILLLFKWGIGLSILFTLLYGVGGKDFLSLLTNDTAVIQEAVTYFYWVIFIPFAGFAAFLWDGILIGATATHWMLYSMLIASCSFFFIYYMLFDFCGNHALWIAFLVYLSLRGIVEWWLWRRLYK